MLNVTIVECIASGPIDGTAMRGKNAYCLINCAHSVRVEYEAGHVDLAPGVSAPYNRVMEARIHSTEDNRIHRVQAYILDRRSLDSATEEHAFRMKHDPAYRTAVQA